MDRKKQFQEENAFLFPHIGHKILLLNARRVVQIHPSLQSHLILLAIEDITEQHALEQKEVLLGMVSHELKTPLTSALLYTESLQGIFERFYRAIDTTQGGVPGLGLGLYLAAKLVKQQGGEIWVESRIGGGTTFSFTLPTGI